MNDSTPDPEPAERKMTLPEALEFAMQFHRRGRLGEAEMLYKRILEVNPHEVNALHYLGVLWHQAGRRDDAVAIIRDSLLLAPDQPEARSNLGNVLKQLGRLDEALDEYDRAIALKPDLVEAHNNKGAVLRALQRYPEAEVALRRAIRLQPAFADAHHNLGNVLRKLDRHGEAEVEYRKSIELKPDQSEAYHSLFSYLAFTGRTEDAAHVLREWLVYQPGHPIATHLLAACTREGIPDRASDAFVREHFDTFAHRFDSHLKVLEYRGPELVGAAVARALGDPAVSGQDATKENRTVLDAGCGTGLSVPYLAPYAARLVGVDLSSGMVERARERGGYEELHVAELTEFLTARTAEYDAIVCTDTFCYFGNLEPAFAATADALRPAGWFFFSVERGTSGDSFVLHHHGRYSHTRSYVERCIQGAGMDIIAIEEGVLRKELDIPVVGLIVTARKAGVTT